MRLTGPAIWIAAILLLPAMAAADESPRNGTEAGDDGFVIPDGFRAKKRGKFTVYCRKVTVIGTRMPAEQCYDQDGIRALMLELRENREKVDQMRRICSSQAACGSR